MLSRYTLTWWNIFFGMFFLEHFWHGVSDTHPFDFSALSSPYHGIICTDFDWLSYKIVACSCTGILESFAIWGIQRAWHWFPQPHSRSFRWSCQSQPIGAKVERCPAANSWRRSGPLCQYWQEEATLVSRNATAIKDFEGFGCKPRVRRSPALDRQWLFEAHGL